MGDGLGLARVPKPPGELRELERLRGQRVRLERVQDLQAMLDRAEEHVGVSEPPRLLPGQVAALGEPVEGAQAVRLAEPWILRSVEELERLDVELDVADPAHAQLDVALLLAAGPEEAVDPALHRGISPTASRSRPGR